MGKGMSDNGFFGENQIGNTNNESRRKLTSRIISGIASELSDKKAAEAAAERRKTQGNGNFTKVGSNDRVNGAAYKYPEDAITKEDKTSYLYGYTTHGGRRLLSVVEALIEEGKYEEVAQIAERDYNHGLEEQNLGMVTNNSVYLDAYRKIASKGKSR